MHWRFDREKWNVNVWISLEHDKLKLETLNIFLAYHNVLSHNKTNSHHHLTLASFVPL